MRFLIWLKSKLAAGSNIISNKINKTSRNRFIFPPYYNFCNLKTLAIYQLQIFVRVLRSFNVLIFDSLNDLFIFYWNKKEGEIINVPKIINYVPNRFCLYNKCSKNYHICSKVHFQGKVTQKERILPEIFWNDGMIKIGGI